MSRNWHHYNNNNFLVIAHKMYEKAPKRYTRVQTSIQWAPISTEKKRASYDKSIQKLSRK